LVLSNRVIHKVEKEKVPILGLGKKDNKHKKAQQKFLQCKKKTKANSKLPFN
jgi:phage anti-repressor protein